MDKNKEQCVIKDFRTILSERLFVCQDLGGDQAVGYKRRRPKLLQRANAAAARGARIKNLVKVVKGVKVSSSILRGNLRKIRNSVRTNAAPAHHYGRTIVGQTLRSPKYTSIRLPLPRATWPKARPVRYPYRWRLAEKTSRKCLITWPPSRLGLGMPEALLLPLQNLHRVGMLAAIV